MFYDLITIKSHKRLEIQNSGQALHNSKKKKIPILVRFTQRLPFPKPFLL